MKERSLSDLTGNVVRDLSSNTEVKDIITFLEAPWGLNMNNLTQPLLPGQKFILKLYYKIPLEEKEKSIVVRDKFNDRTLHEFTEKEYLKYLYNEGRCNISYIDDFPRNELVLVIGRRGTKSSISAMIASYETYKLLRLYHPQKHYKMLPDSEIHLTCIATNEDQSNLLFRQLLGNFAQCNYFHRYMNKPLNEKVTIRSRRDLEKYGEEGRATIVVKSAACSARGLRGSGNIVTIMDEQAHFLDDGASASNKSDKAVYDAVTPSVAQFGYDGKIINISSPLNKTGVLWDLYNKSLEGAENILMIKAPCWEINSALSSNFLKGRYQNDPISYDCEYGGDFSDRVRAWMPEDYLRNIIVSGLKPKTHGVVKKPYFMGVDIGLKGDGTSICISHIDTSKDDSGVTNSVIEVDVIDRISAGEGQYKGIDVLDFEKIADWIYAYTQKFYIVKGLLDQHNGELAAQNLAKRGMTQFDLVYHTRNFNSELYQTFMMLTIDKKIRLFNDAPSANIDSELIEEILRLQVVQHSKNIIEVQAPKLKGHHDDNSDALVRSVWLAQSVLKTGHIGNSLSTYNNVYTYIHDSNHYGLIKSRIHNIPNNQRSIRRARNNNWFKK